ncbi:hypothetical protein Pmani_013996 [Petrolisthes manimaculis]|uniref:GSKIP domain-containing protein n=1 Tax=Petrolisthes manimaculis TaxID=1843537 RepID=A0AAE1PTR6_9EUCA|nr:hypothetical protein Pmani_013996 [Petrolisthes manimaculis]
MDEQEERVLDEQEWHVEAAAVIQDVKECVENIIVSSLPVSDTTIYFNLTTKEKNSYCIELTASGFRIVSDKYDDKSQPTEDYFETPYSLLDNISPLYRQSFSNALSAKLLLLAEQGERELAE